MSCYTLLLAVGLTATCVAVAVSCDTSSLPDTDCTVRFQDNDVCACSTLNSRGPVKCRNDSNNIKVQPCFCAYYDRVTNQTIVGDCYYTCYQSYNTIVEVDESSDFNNDFCTYDGDYNRRGFFCYECNASYALGVYSNLAIDCIPCEYYGYRNWLKYCAMLLLPLTAMYILAVMLSCNVTSSSFSGIILVIQLITSSPLRTFIADGTSEGFRDFVKFVVSLLEFVNLNFYCAYSFTDVCLHPKMTALEVWSLDYITALYPFVLIFVTYLLVTAYDKEYRLLVWMWKPFKKCIRHYRKTWDIRNSLIEIFATFILLSSSKILLVSFLILSWTSTYDVYGNKVREVVTMTANVEYFGREHLPFALLAIIISFIFVILPILLLAVYPCRCFQKCLNQCGLRLLTLHVFMDVFQGSYKLHPRDMRYFSTLYLLLRVVMLAHARLFLSPQTLYISGILSMASAVLIMTCQPYKVSTHNIVDSVLLLLMGTYFLSRNETSLLRTLDYNNESSLSAIVQGLSLALIIAYFVMIVMWKLLGKKISSVVGAIKSKTSFVFNRHRRNSYQIESFDKDRDSSLSISKHYPPLLRDSY